MPDVEPLLEQLTADHQRAEIQRAMGRVEGKLDSLIAALTAHFADDAKAFSDIRARISGTERKLNYFAGAWAVAGAVVLYIWKGWH